MNNLYISVSRPASVRESHVTIRMALHPDLPDVHTWFRSPRHKRPYRMVYCVTAQTLAPLEEMKWACSCLGVDSDYYMKTSFEKALVWLQGGEWDWPV